MLKFVVLCALVAMCAAQKSSGSYTGYTTGSSGSYTGYVGGSSTLEIREPLPVEVAPSGGALVSSQLASETMEYPAPSLGASAPLVHLPKGGQEVVDIPHADIRLPGNSIQNKDLHLNLPSPIVEAPKPIIQQKDVLFRLPQPIFYVPKPIIQHKPIVYKVPHTLRTITPIVNTRPYLFQVPSAQITGKSSYTQAVPY